MIKTYAYDVEILPNFFSVTIVDVGDYLNKFSNACDISIKKGKEIKTPKPLTQIYTVKEITNILSGINKYEFYITDKDDSQLLKMLGFFNDLRPSINQNGEKIINHLFGYNSNSYDKLMIAGLLMYGTQVNNVKELITKLYELSKTIISSQDDKEGLKNNYIIKLLNTYTLPYVNIDIMTIFALNKVGTGEDAKGNKIYFGKSLKQTSINLQWYELLEYELPPISDLDNKFYHKIDEYRGLNNEELNKRIKTWDRYIIDEWIPDMMKYNANDVFIVCEMIRLYIEEIRLRYNISKAYEINVLSSSRSNIADKLFVKFYSEFSGLSPQQWRGKKTERTAMAFKRIIFDFIKFKTPELQEMLEEMKKVIIYSIGKDAFKKEIKLGNLVYTIATGGLHSQDIPRELRSKLINIDSFTGKSANEMSANNNIWDNITDDSYIYVHWDIKTSGAPIKKYPLNCWNIVKIIVLQHKMKI